MEEVLSDVEAKETFTYPDNDVSGENLLARESGVVYRRVYTYVDFITWPDDIRAEIVNGIVCPMPPPAIRHQNVVLEIATQIKAAFKGKPHKVYIAPVAVRLFPRPDGSDTTVFEPDVVVLKDTSIVGENSIAGVPDMLVEVLSPSTARYDRTVKHEFYRKAGVKEYWIVDPNERRVDVFLLRNGGYVKKTYTRDETVTLALFPDCTIDLRTVFE
jgi:Uma2 family endonuclease